MIITTTGCTLISIPQLTLFSNMGMTSNNILVNKLHQASFFEIAILKRSIIIVCNMLLNAGKFERIFEQCSSYIRCHMICSNLECKSCAEVELLPSLMIKYRSPSFRMQENRQNTILFIAPSVIILI